MKKKKVSIQFTILSILTCILFSLFVSCSSINQTNTSTLFEDAVIDSMTIEDDEFFPLVEISKESELVRWNENGEILMISFHDDPEKYINGQEYLHSDGEVWTFTDKEIIDWYSKNKKDLENNPLLRFQQLIGLREDSLYTHFTAFWVNPDDMIRPAYTWELSDNTAEAMFETEPSKEFKLWFNDNIIYSYFYSAYPWTRLGYTYDWADNGIEYGLSEFLILPNSVSTIEFTLSMEDFILWMESQI